MRGVLAALDRSGLTRREFAQRRGLRLSTLDYWRQRLRALGDDRSRGPKSRFVELAVAEVAAAPVASGELIEVVLRNGRCLRVPLSLESEVVGALARALDPPC